MERNTSLGKKEHPRGGGIQSKVVNHTQIGITIHRCSFMASWVDALGVHSPSVFIEERCRR